MAILASGSGTNAENIARYFEGHSSIHVQKILSNKRNAFVHERARQLGIPSVTFTRAEFLVPTFLDELEGIDYLILAGFLWLIPKYLVHAYPDRIINIHPALLPKYGGKGMYGAHVHQAVVAHGEQESGITIHLVNEEYDKGDIIFQSKCNVDRDDNISTVAQKVQQLEHQYFPEVVEQFVLEQV